MTRSLVTTLLVLLAAGAAHAQAPFSVERAGAGRAMILIPGLLSGGDVWAGTVAEFSGEYDMHVLTLPGFAGVEAVRDTPYLAAMRDAVIRYIREHELERPVLVGHSLGAFLAFWIAATAPEVVGPVVAVDGVPFLSALMDTSMTPARAASQAAMVRASMAGLTPEALGAQTRSALAAQTRDGAGAAAGERWGRASDAATAATAVAEMMTTDLRAEVSRITTPVLLLMAADGMPEPMRDMLHASYSAQVARVRDARVVVAADARHFIMLDDPGFLHREMRSFLADR